MARRLTSRYRYLDSNGQAIDLTTTLGNNGGKTADSVELDKPNEEVTDGTEQSHPDDNGVMYSLDAPGHIRAIDNELVKKTDLTPIPYHQYEARINAAEFVRVGIGEDADPAGNAVSGSRASYFVNWHVRHKATWDETARRLNRTTGDITESDDNDVGPGHIGLTFE